MIRRHKINSPHLGAEQRFERVTASAGIGATGPSSEQMNDDGTKDTYDFSLILGGPLYQLFCRAHLCGEVLEMLRRRILVLGGAAWLPLLVLSVLEGNAWGRAVKVPLLLDWEVY